MWRDLLLAARSLRRAPAFSAAAIVTLALGVGATSAIFSVVNAVLLEALPYHEPERLVMVRAEVQREEAMASPIGLLDVASLTGETRTTFSDLVPVSSTRNFNLSAPGGDGEVEHVAGEMTTDRFFSAFGVPMALGRGFTPEEVVAPGVPVVVLGHELWERRYGRDPGVLGRTLVLNELPYTIVGVAAPGFAGFGDRARLWLPIGMAHRLYGPHYTDMRQFRWISAVARLAPGVTLEESQRTLQLASTRLQAEFPKENEKFRYVATSLTEAYVGDQRRSLWSMFAAAGLVLLIGCANIANLLLARAVARRREFAVRVALGAGRPQLVRQVLAESLVLGAAGLGLGLALAVGGSRALVASSALPLASFTRVEIDLAVVLTTIALTLLCTVGFGVVPALVALRAAPTEGMGDGAKGATAGRARGRLQRTLIGAEVALAAMLLTGATVMTKGFAGFQRTDVGFAPESLLTLRVDLTAERYRTNEPVWGLLSRLVEEGRAVPGVRELALEGPGLPTSGWYQITVTRPAANGEAEELPARRHHVTPGYFSTLGIRLLAGRDFTAQDAAGAERTIVIGERLARRLWPGESPLGRTLHSVGPTPIPLTIVGIVRDVEHGGLQADGTTWDDIYLSALQSPPRTPALLTLFVRTSAPTSAILPALQQVLRGIDPNLPFFDVRPMRARLDEQTASGRFLVRLMGTFALLGLVLAAVGVYGVIAYSVTQRTRELGVRLALGATRGGILRHVVTGALVPVGAGLVAGYAGVWALGRVVQGLLYGVPAVDPAALGLTTVVLLAVAIVASWLPARRAAAIEPVIALRSE